MPGDCDGAPRGRCSNMPDCMSSSRSFRRRAIAWPFVVAALIFFASSQSTVAAPKITEIDDKLAHFAVYGLLATLVCRIGSGWRAALCSLIVVSAFGATDEWHQSFVPGREADVGDWIADTLGAAIAVGFYAGCARYRRLLEMPIGTRRPAREA